MQKIQYCAQPFNSKFRVCRIISADEHIKYEFLGDVIKFDTFDEANKVAMKIANGEFECLSYPRGEFVNMR